MNPQQRTSPFLWKLFIAALLVACGLLLARAEASGGPGRRAFRLDGNFRRVGAYVFGGVWSGMEPYHRLERVLGRRLEIAHWFMSWDNAWDGELAAQPAAEGRLPMISWEPHGVNLPDISAGHYDDYVRSWARGVREHEGLVYLRIFPEMNGDWTPWNGNPKALRDAWRHIYQIFEAEGASNVRFVWAPNGTDEPRLESNRMENYYPGDDYVHVVAFSAYNWGTVRDWSSWSSFYEVVAEPYRRLDDLAERPIWIAEMATTGEGGDKEQWIHEMLMQEGFWRLSAVVWFEEDKETDWRIESTRGGMVAFREWMTDLAPSSGF